MATARLIPSSYSRSSTNRVTVTDPSNMYMNTDDTESYCTLRGRNQNSSTAYYAFIGGFNFGSIPSNAKVSAFTVKIRCYRSSNQRTGTNYYLRLCSSASNNSVISGTTTSTNIGTTASVITIPTGDLTWSMLSGYGSDFCIEVPLSSNSSSYPYVYVYGAEIDVTYSLPVSYNITVTGDNSKVSPTGTTSVFEGESFSVSANYDSRPTVTDNNIDVSNQLVEMTGGTANLIPYNSTVSNFTVTDISNAYTDADSSNYARFDAAGGGTTGTVYLDLGGAVIPSNATIQSVSCQATLQYNRNGSSSGASGSCQLYSGTTAKGSSQSLISAGGTDVAKTTYTLTTGSWTAAELANARFYMTMTNNASSTHRYMYIYGVTLTVTYSISGKVYVYTLSNITADHTIVVTATATDVLYVKVGGSWVSATAVYKKVSGSWVEQTDLTSVFDSGTNYKYVE